MDKNKIAKEILSQSYNVTDQAGEELQVVDVKDVFDIVSRIVDSAFLLGALKPTEFENENNLIMTYSAVHKGLIVNQEDLQLLADLVKYSMKKYRIITCTPLGKRDKSGMLQDIDHAERALLEGLRKTGVDLGVEWGADLDLSHESE
jgi:hypothetical protein